MSCLMRFLALDLGAKRIGLALSDPTARIAFPAGALQRRGRKRDLAALRELIREKQVEAVVVGLPLHMDGRVGEEAQAARRFARDLSAATGLSVDTLDERWTSVEAERALRESPRKARRKRENIDAVAATILLRTYLARRESELVGGRD